MHSFSCDCLQSALTKLLVGEPILSDEKKRQMNILRNKEHFKQSDAELQLMRDELKKQRQHKIANMAKEKSRREDKRREFKLKAIHGSEYTESDH